MIEVIKKGIILKKTKLGFENAGVLNPAVIEDNGKIHFFYRAVRKGNYSSIGYCDLSDPFTVGKRLEEPILFPQLDYEMQGMEDPRIVKIDNLFYLTYTAYDGVNALGALAVSKDLITFVKVGLISPRISYEEFKHLAESRTCLNEKYFRYNAQSRLAEKQERKTFVWDKNLIFFPRRIDGKLYFLHRIKPDIQIVAVNHLEDLAIDFWQNYFLHLNEHIVLAPKYKHEVSYLGGGCPPIETAIGWLIIYHGVHDTINGYVYSACAALLDLDNPQKEIARLPYPLFKPDKEWELNGEVNNVCFPTGVLLIGDTLYIYYGAADEQIACAHLSLSELLKELTLNT
jgi:beta-1,2-mannobiose phosphorylase / 1,2-beta-oligomannan phosphorylase